jgi:hypothetical protein
VLDRPLSSSASHFPAISGWHVTSLETASAGSAKLVVGRYADACTISGAVAVGEEGDALAGCGAEKGQYDQKEVFRRPYYACGCM